MPDNNRRPSEQDNRLHRTCFAEKRFFKWIEDEVSVSLRNCGGSYGGGSEVLVIDTLVFDEAQITSPLNYSVPTWGGQCHPLTKECGRAIVIIKEQYDDLSERSGNS